MINKNKIITMTKLAVYDKNEGVADRLVNDYFRHDYIYKKNMATRFFTGIGAIILVGLYWLRTFFIDGADLFEMDLMRYIRVSVLFVIAVMSFYSVIGTIQGTRQYYLMQKRLKKYTALMHQLERINERARKRAEERNEERNNEGTTDLVYGTNIDRKRDRR